MRTDHIRTFLKVCETGSLAAAARALDLSPAAVSKQMSALEHTVGTALLARTTRKLDLTAAGHIYRKYAADTLRQIDVAEQACLSQLRGHPVGRLRVVAARVLAEKFLLPHLPDFILAHPDVELQIELAERFPDLEHDPADLVFGMTMEGTAGLKRRTLCRAAYWLCGSPDYLARHALPERISDLAGHRLIVHLRRVVPQRLWFKGGREIDVPVVLALDDTRAMVNAACAGVGLVSVHDYMVREEVMRGDLVRLLPAFEAPPRPLHLIYRNTGPTQPALRAFIDFAVAHCQPRLARHDC